MDDRIPQEFQAAVRLGIISEEEAMAECMIGIKKQRTEWLRPELQVVDGNYNQPAPDTPWQPSNDLTMNAERLLALDLPPIEQVCGPLYNCGVLMIAGVAGVGKSLFTLSLAAHIAAGKNFAGWHTPRALPVMYVDGEMATQYLQSRLKRLPVTSELGMISLESMRQCGDFVDFSQARWRDWFVNSWIFECYEVFIFDTVSSLVLPHKEGDLFAPEYWLQLESFHQQFRAHNKTVIWVDNLNKSGEVFGTSAKHHKVDSMWKFTKWDGCPYLNTAAFTMEQGKLRGDTEDAAGHWYFHPEHCWKQDS